MDSSLLPAPAPPPRPVPKRALSLALVPAVALAGGVLVQRVLDPPGGDALLRWLVSSSAVGLLAGAAAGTWLRARIAWMVYGAIAPWAIAGLVAF